MATASLDSRAIPAEIRSLVDTLASAGHDSHLVGGCVRDLLRSLPSVDFDIATAAPPEAVLELFPRAVPIGLRHGTVMVPTSSGLVDVTTFRAGPRLEDDLAHRDFTVNAMAYDPRNDRLCDPFEGCKDLTEGRLRAVRSAADRFAEDPLRALRGARLVASHGLAASAEVEAAMPGARQGLREVARERVRRELALLLLAPGVAEGIALLRRTGLEADLAPGIAADAGPVVAALPRDLELRLAGWLRGANAGSILRRLRFSRRAVQRVERLLRHHPIEGHADPQTDAAVRRLIKRVGEADLAACIELRRAELGLAGTDAPGDAQAAARRLQVVEDAVARVCRSGALALRRLDLTLDGGAVMEVLGCGPSPFVGRALGYLTDCVVEDPSRNTPEHLRELLAAWAADPANAPASDPRRTRGTRS